LAPTTVIDLNQVALRLSSVTITNEGATMKRFYLPLKLLLIATALTAAVSFEVRLAVSAYLLRNARVDAAFRAARFTPEDEEIFLRLADLDPSHRGEYLREASELNSYDARPWLERGFLAELDHHPNEASLDLRQAARLDSRTAPAWALANFYFRQGDMKAFYFWGNQYRRVADGNTVGLYRLAWSRDPRVATLLKGFSPMTCKELAAMGGFLVSHAEPSAITQVDELLASCSTNEAVRFMTEDVARLLRADRPEEALGVWNSFHKHNVDRQANVEPGVGHALNTISSANPLGDLGFNWSVNRTPGIRVRWLPQRQAAEFTFDGSEPEVSTLLFQPVVLTAGRSYRLNCRLQSEDSHESGFSWRLVELSTGKTVENELGNDTIPQNSRLAWTFQAPPTSKTLVLAFTYVRPAGTTRKDGTITLSDITLVPAVSPAAPANPAISEVALR
jgi:hypothetical protein